MTTKKLRWGVLGTAGIGRRVIPGINASERNEVVAVASRSLEKAKKYAEELNIPTAYGSYEELLADPTIDAVYIPLPNHLHKPWTIKAAEAGKHVLCEKPIALDEKEAEEMVAACEKAGVILVEAYMHRHQPRLKKIKQQIKEGVIGDIRGIRGSFTFNNAGDVNNIRYKKEWGGGSIYDVGCYPISTARFILDEEPTAVTCHAFFSPEHDNVDMMAAGLVEFSNGVSLTFDCSMWAAGRNDFEIIGTRGRIILNPAYTGDQSYTIIKDGKAEVIEEEYVDTYTLQADDFAACVLDGKPLKFSYENLINGIKVVKAAVDSAEKGERIVL